VLDIVSVFCRRDLAAQVLQARSIRRFMPAADIGRIFFIYNDTQDSSGDALFHELATLLPRQARIAHFSDFGVDAAGVERDGWTTQQVLKLEVSRMVQAENYLVLDAKNHFIAPTSRNDFISEAGRLFARVSEDRDVAPLTYALNYLQVPTRQHPICGIWGHTPFVIKTAPARELVEHLMARDGQSLTRTFFNHHRKLTEFQLYQAFLPLCRQGLEKIYEDSAELGLTLWRGMAQDGRSFRAALKEVDKGQLKLFAVHWAAAVLMAQEQVNEVARFWLERGLVACVRDGMDILEWTRTHLSENDQAYLDSIAQEAP
jgi:hypothetical protein